MRRQQNLRLEEKKSAKEQRNTRRSPQSSQLRNELVTGTGEAGPRSLRTKARGIPWPCCHLVAVECLAHRKQKRGGLVCGFILQGSFTEHLMQAWLLGPGNESDTAPTSKDRCSLHPGSDPTLRGLLPPFHSSLWGAPSSKQD